MTGTPLTRPLNIYAGPTALKRLRQDGFHPALFDYFLGASGGPKWFVLAGLDRVLFPEFFHDTDRQVNIVGSSAGAFRAACMTQSNPLKAINRLAESYSQTVYSDKPTSGEITGKAVELLHYMLDAQGAEQILSNSRFKAHLITARCHGIVGRPGKWSQLSGLALSAAGNMLNRRNLQRRFTRVIFSTPNSHLDIVDPYSLKTEQATLSQDNIADVLLASGSIPLVLDGVSDIEGAAPGVYRDGGIVDYHFDLAFENQQGLTLYPHFYPRPVTGWFDKKLKNRHVHARSYDNVVMLVPSSEFVETLPYKKIPDRTDFEVMTPDIRLPYWKTVLNETDRLGEYFMNKVTDGTIMDEIQPLPFPCLPN